MKLCEAFDVVRGDMVAFIGAGGKTSALVGLGYELVDLDWRVLATTSTRIAEEQLDLVPHAMRYTSEPEAISNALNEHKFVFLYDSIENGKVYGPPVEWMRRSVDVLDSDVLLIEADGSKQLPFKAPYDHEPVIPDETSLVVPVVSLSVLGQPLDDDHVYNPEAMTAKYGFYPGGRIKSPWVAQVLRDEELGLRGIPDSARVVAFLNRTPKRGYLRGRGRLIARLTLRSPRIHAVALGTVRAAAPVHEVQRSVGAVVLAAGMSSRMGQSKMLLPWTEKKTIIEHIVDKLVRARIDHIVVVTGHLRHEVKQLVKPFGVKVVHNRAYKRGEMLSSLKAGLRAMPDHVAASMVVLGDQPRIQPKVIYRVLSTYSRSDSHRIIAPSYQMRRGHPILIPRRYWPEILALRGDRAPRDVINAHQDQITYVVVDTDSVLRDVDTPQDYATERFRAGLISRSEIPQKPDH